MAESDPIPAASTKHKPPDFLAAFFIGTYNTPI
jgi:hypothetical protein